jgi:microsomal epoxide hydrolase
VSRPRAFTLRVGDDILDDLRERLEHARFPDVPPHGEAWEYGTDVEYLRDLVAYWRDSFDWRKQEDALNAFPQYRVAVAGVDLHFLHVPGLGPEPLPLLLSHGWPGSIWEFHKIIPLLTDPARWGGDPADAFAVVAPSLPGYTLSFQPGQPRFGIAEMGGALVELMRNVLGYEQFLAQGGDWGAYLAAWIGMHHPSCALGIHLTLLPGRRDALDSGTDLSPEMHTYREELAFRLREESGYSAIQATKPQTLAFGLTDSPLGLAAWIIEKFRSWSDNGGDLERSFSRDALLTNIMLYWATGAIASSFWPYYARLHSGLVLPSAERRVEVPTAYQSFPKEFLHPPRSVAEQAFNIQRWTTAPRGGHFAALEEPQLLAEDIRAFARVFR